jgi:hypothetical protein
VHSDRFVPLLALHDRHDRNVGWGASLLAHGANKAMNGSRWLSFGITNASFYTAADFVDSIALLVSAAFGSGALPVPFFLASHDAGVTPRLSSAAPLSEPAPLPKLRLSAIRNGNSHFVYTDPSSGLERRWFMLGCNLYRAMDFGPMTADEIANQFAAVHDAGATAIRAFSWEKILEQPELRAAAVRAARVYNIRILVELNCKPEKDPTYQTQAGTVAATVAAASALQHDTDVFFAFDMCK